MDIWLVVGLGNPGKEYENTRHNVGFKMVEFLRHHFGASNFKKIANFAEISSFKIKNNNIILAKPLTFMNLSGTAVQYLLSFYKIPLNNLCVIHDDIDLKFSHVKTKQGGSSGGHNGLKSIDKLLGANYFRIRIGVDRPKEKSMVTSYVLGNFSDEELQKLDTLYQFLSEHFQTFLEDKNKFAVEVGKAWQHLNVLH